MKKCGLQLYSLKDVINSDFKGVLKQVKDIGYTGVEFASGNYGGLSAAELKSYLKEVGLDPISSHIQTAKIAEHVEYAKELGLRYLIDPMAPMGNREEALAFAEKLNLAGEICAKAGILFGYHNHRHEFVKDGGEYLFETLILNTDSSLVCFQLDVGWAACAGVDVPSFINKYPERFKLIHIKECGHVGGAEPLPDFSIYPKDENGRPQIPPEVIKKFQDEAKWNVKGGEGVIDWNVVVEAAAKNGATDFIVEREYDYAGDIFKCVKEDFDFVSKI